VINVTKAFLPPINEYKEKIDEIWSSGWITNNGKFVRQLEDQLKEMLGLKHLYFCANGTVVLQIALKALGIAGEVITTPFSYVATTNTIIWEGCTPVFADINEDDFNIDCSRIEKLITPKTQAILATHVYGNPCNVDVIAAIAAKYGLKVIYDGAHAFGVNYQGKSLLSYGDITTCSFHATKIFHTVEGGSISCNNDELADKIMKFRQFGHINDDYFSIGINGKNSEFHAAMGLCNLKHLSNIVESRKQICQWYDEKFRGKVGLPAPLKSTTVNYAYYPIILKSEEILLSILKELNEIQIFPRRYFYPSLNQLSYLIKPELCPVSEDVSKRILSLPLFYQMEKEIVDTVASIVQKNILIC
jgi:dTDP-4-amino-4,6-dideoxygalactose transaminase